MSGRPHRTQGGPEVLAADIALSAGFGTTATVAVEDGASDVGGRFTVTSAGTGQGANPTATLTFKKAFDGVPTIVCSRGNETGDDQLSIPVIVKASKTMAIFTLVGTPVAAETYSVSFVALDY